MRYATIGLACGVGCWGLLAATVHAGEVKAGNLAITQAWSRATPGSAQVAGGYLTIENKGSQPDRLLSASTNAAKKIEIHEMALDKGIMTMRPIDGGLFIEAGKTVKFEPGGRHLMLIGLAAPLAEGEQVSVSLAFERAGQVNVPFAVQGVGGRAPDPLTRVEATRKPAPVVAADDPDEPFFTQRGDGQHQGIPGPRRSGGDRYPARRRRRTAAHHGPRRIGDARQPGQGHRAGDGDCRTYRRRQMGSADGRTAIRALVARSRHQAVGDRYRDIEAPILIR